MQRDSAQCTLISYGPFLTVRFSFYKSHSTGDARQGTTGLAETLQFCLKSASKLTDEFLRYFLTMLFTFALNFLQNAYVVLFNAVNMTWACNQFQKS